MLKTCCLSLMLMCLAPAAEAASDVQCRLSTGFIPSSPPQIESAQLVNHTASGSVLIVFPASSGHSAACCSGCFTWMGATPN